MYYTLIKKQKFSPPQINTLCFAESASLHAELYMSMVCLSSCLSLLISASMSSYILEKDIYHLSSVFGASSSC